MTTVSRYDVLGFGAVAVDDLLYVDTYPMADGKVRVHRRTRQCGGLTGTALVAAARLGARCAYGGTLGCDELSGLVEANFRSEGVDVDAAVRRPDARPAFSTIVVGQRDGTRTVFASLGGMLGPDPQRPDAETIRSTKVVLIDHHGVEGTARIVGIAREAGVAVVADFERDGGPGFSDLVRAVDHLVIGEPFALMLTATGTAKDAAESLWVAGRQAVVVTCGKSGCWYVAEGGPPATHCKAFDVESRDTTGCGDVFHGAYSAGLAEGLDCRSRVVLASSSAAIKAMHYGGQEGIPVRDAVEAFLKRAHPE